MHVVFGSYELEVDKRELRRAGEVVPLEPKAFNVLVYLLTHRHRAVSKSELLETLWPQEYVTDAALTRSVRLIRQAVGDTGHRQHIIKTLRGYGYRFMADMTLHPVETMRETASERLSGDVWDAHVSEGSPAVASAPQEAAQPESASTPEALDALVPSYGDVAPLPDIPPKTADAERRPLTVLVCDLVQGAQLAEQLDPEDLRQVMRAYHTTCERVLTQYGGYLAQRLGSRLVVYFGYPQAQEDAAQRAVLTGLALLKALSVLGPEMAPPQAATLSLRVGIDSGLVVVETGGDERAAPVAMGSPQSRAVQLQEAAAPQSVVISSNTQHLVQGWFRCNELSPHVFKGSDTTVPIYQVMGRSGVQHRLEAAPPGGLTPLVGREHEVGLLSERWQRVCEGQGQVVVLSGEAGIGKSRLVQVLKEEVISESHVLWECRSSPYYQNTALHPITELLHRVVDWQSDDAPVTRLDKLEAFLSQTRLTVSDTAPLLAPLLSIPLPEARYPPLGLSPQRQRQKTLESLVALVLEQTAPQPVLLILEDLHWTDPTTLELLDLLVAQVPTASILILITYRPEFQPAWGQNRSYLTQVTLNRLSRRQIESIAMQVADGKALPDQVLEQIVVRTDGVPLYVEEMTKALLESGVLKEMDERYELTGAMGLLTIPATLQDSLLARLDRLVTAKAVAQYASVIGRQFSFELLQAVVELDEATLQRELRRLVEAELVYQRGLPPQASYMFKHALVQDTAYESLLRSTRQGYHRRIAEVLEERFLEATETQPELVAHHYTEAGLIAQAVPYWQRAVQQASNRSAYLEAISHCTTGIELLTTLPETPEYTQYTLSLYIALGAALQMAKGHAAPEVEHAYTRAYALCQRMGETPELGPVLLGLWRFYNTRLQLRSAREVGETLLRLARRVHDPVLEVIAHPALGLTCFLLSALPVARQHLEAGIALYTPDQHRSPTFRVGQDPGVSCRAYAGMTLWLLGYPEQALAHVHEGLALARALSHPYSLAFAQFWVAWVSQVRRDVPAVREHAEAAVALSSAQGFPLWMATATTLRGWALAEQGQVEEGIVLIRQCLDTSRATGAKLGRSHFLALLAEAHGKAGQAEEGLSALTEVLTLADKSGERFYEAELYRLKGELVLQSRVGSRASEADACFQKAIEMAHKQQAKSLELRAATSLAKWWQSQGKRDEARELLEPVYSWFTEGFDTADLIDAKTLLNEL